MELGFFVLPTDRRVLMGTNWNKEELLRVAECWNKVLREMMDFSWKILESCLNALLCDLL